MRVVTEGRTSPVPAWEKPTCGFCVLLFLTFHGLSRWWCTSLRSWVSCAGGGHFLNVHSTVIWGESRFIKTQQQLLTQGSAQMTPLFYHKLFHYKTISM